MNITWQQFEEDCFNYLSKLYCKRCKIISVGKSDSTKSDIEVQTNKSSFYIEVKKAKAQSGQFVLLPNLHEEKFYFSSRNKTKPNDLTQIITDYMNSNFKDFNNAGTSGKELDVDTNIFQKWIVSYYKSKGVKYIITKGFDYIILPVSKFKDYFNVTAKYRIKRSGSSSPSKMYHTKLIDILKTKYKIDNHKIEGKKFFVTGDNSIDKLRFIEGAYEYYLSSKDNNVYEVRQLSNTYNMNVIFSITLIKEQDPEDIEIFNNEF